MLKLANDPTLPHKEKVVFEKRELVQAAKILHQIDRQMVQQPHNRDRIFGIEAALLEVGGVELYAKPEIRADLFADRLHDRGRAISALSVVDEDVSAGGGELQRDLGADPARRSGDENDPFGSEWHADSFRRGRCVRRTCAAGCRHPTPIPKKNKGYIRSR